MQITAIRDEIGTSGPGGMNDGMHKLHLFYQSHPLLQSRLLSSADFPLLDLSLSSVRERMANNWTAMIQEGVLSRSRISNVNNSLTSANHSPITRFSTPAIRSPTPAPLSSSSAPRFSMLTAPERDELMRVGGCFFCRQTPSSPNWTPHTSINCPQRRVNGSLPPVAVKTEITAAVFTLSDEAGNHWMEVDADNYASEQNEFLDEHITAAVWLGPSNESINAARRDAPDYYDNFPSDDNPGWSPSQPTLTSSSNVAAVIVEDYDELYDSESTDDARD